MWYFNYYNIAVCIVHFERRQCPRRNVWLTTTSYISTGRGEKQQRKEINPSSPALSTHRHGGGGGGDDGKGWTDWRRNKPCEGEDGEEARPSITEAWYGVSLCTATSLLSQYLSSMAAVHLTMAARPPLPPTTATRRPGRRGNCSPTTDVFSPLSGSSKAG